MFNKILKSIKNPQKALRYLGIFIYNYFRKNKGVLFFLGMDDSGEFSLLFRGYEQCYGFEPNPERFNKLVKKYGKHSNIHLFNVAVAKEDGEVEFNISSNNGASSSIGTFKEEWEDLHSSAINMVRSIRVKSVNLHNFCQSQNIEYIDDYISDIQGMDLDVLKTIQPMIELRKIGTIRCEVTKDGKENIYKNLPDNSEAEFNKLLGNNYVLIAKGKGILTDNKFEYIPEDEWEMDCKWKLKAL